MAQLFVATNKTCIHLPTDQHQTLPYLHLVTCINFHNMPLTFISVINVTFNGNAAVNPWITTNN